MRHELEAFHGHTDAKAVETAWRYLNHEDRFIRFAARTALEHQGVTLWRERALQEKDLKEVEKVLDAGGAPWTEGRLPAWKGK